MRSWIYWSIRPILGMALLLGGVTGEAWGQEWIHFTVEGQRPDRPCRPCGVGVAVINAISLVDGAGIEWLESGGVAYLSNSGYTGGDTSPSGAPILAFNTTQDEPPGGTHEVRFYCAADEGDPAPATVERAGVWVADTDGAPSPRVIVTSFDAEGFVLESQGLYSSSGVLKFMIGPIASLEFFDNGGDGHAIDDLAYSGLLCLD